MTKYKQTPKTPAATPTDEYRLTPTMLAAAFAVYFLGAFVGAAAASWIDGKRENEQAAETLRRASSQVSIAEALIDSLDADRMRAFEGGIEVGAHTREVHVFMEDNARDSYCYNVPELANVCCWTAR